MLSIGGAPFGTDGDASSTAAESVKRGIEANFGTAGPAFVGRLQKRLVEDGGPGKLRARHGELTELLRGSTDMTGRRAPLVACLALAAELAADWEIVPFSAPDTDTWLSLLASDEQRDNRPEMALDIVREYIAAHSDKLWGGPPKEDKKADKEAGGDERPPAARLDRPRRPHRSRPAPGEAPRGDETARLRTGRRAAGLAGTRSAR